MKQLGALILLATIVGISVDSLAIEPAYREIEVSLVYGVATPGGDWKSRMSSGSGLGLNLGMTVTPRVTVGLHSSVDSLDPEYASSGLSEAAIGDSKWSRYTGVAYGEYYFTNGVLAPFLGASIGVHGVHISYARPIDGVDGIGDYGFGYGITAGLRYRSSKHVGVVLRADSENASGMTDGWFYSLRAGVSFFI